MTSNQFSIRLHEARQMMGLSMEKLAELTGGIITKQSISRYEKGLMLPKRVAKLAMASFPKTNCKPWKQNSRFGQSSILPRRKMQDFLLNSIIR